LYFLSFKKAVGEDMKHIQKYVVLSALFCLILGFQNCNKVDFQGGETALNQKAGSPADQSLDPAVVSMDDEDHIKNCDKSCDDDEVCEGDDIDSEKEYEEYALDCDMAKKASFVEVAKDSSLDHLRGSYAYHSDAFASVSDVRGKLILSSNSISDLSNTRGNLAIFGEGIDPLIKNKHDSRGKSFLCGISADVISKHRGGILVIDGDISKLSDHRGNVVVINGNIGDIDNVRGTIRVINGKVLGSVKNFKGVIREQ
jgi:hypothetical protein